MLQALTNPAMEQGGWNLYAYCQRNPVNWVDPSGLIIIATGDQQYLDQVVAVITRLANDSDPFMANLLHTLSESATKYTISFTPGKKDNFNGRNAINWDPTAAGKQYISLLQYPREYWVMTPARLLGHELIHTYHFDTDPCAYGKNSAEKGFFFDMRHPSLWDNMEEYLTGQTENEHIHGVGGNLRLRHNGDYIKVAGPFSTQ